MPIYYLFILLLMISSLLQIVFVAIGSNSAMKQNLRTLDKE